MLRFALILLFCVSSTLQTGGITGSVELDELNFAKIIKKFNAALVKFDIAYPYGEKHENFMTVAKEAKELDDFVVASVGVKDYGDKDNEVLASRYGIKKDDFPAVLLFKNGDLDKPISFKPDKYSTDELRNFIVENTGFHLTLPGCIQKLDLLAIKFLKAPEDKRKKFIAGIAEAQTDFVEKDKKTAKVYKLIMEKVVEKGDGFIDSELERVKKLLTGKMTEEKKKELQIKENILRTFKQNQSLNMAKNEL